MEMFILQFHHFFLMEEEYEVELRVVEREAQKNGRLADLERDPHVELRFGTEFFFRNLEDAVDYAKNAPNLQCSLLINCCGELQAGRQAGRHRS